MGTSGSGWAFGPHGVACSAALLLGACGSERSEPAPRAPKVAELPATVVAVPPARQMCPEWHPPEDGIDYGLQLTEPLPIPAEFRDIASATKTVITVQGVAGKPACVELGWISEAFNFSLTDDKRFFGFGHHGFEASGYTIVDRIDGTDIETGEQPVFSKDRTRFASVQVTVSSMGDFEGLGVWQILPDRTVQLAFVKAEELPGADDFQIDRWVGNDCAELSAISIEEAEKLRGSDTAKAYAIGLSKAPRIHFRFVPVAGKWRLEPAEDNSPCFRIKAPS
jgi:hypothetical protein